jgi:putative ABC transport system permease protein
MNRLRLAWKNVLRNRRRSFTALAITAVGTAAVLIGGGFALYTYESLRELTARDTGHVVLAAQRHFDGDEDVPLRHGLAGAPALAQRVGAQPGVRAVLPRVQFSGLVSNGEKSAVFVGTGVAPEAEFRLRGPQLAFTAGEPLGASTATPEVVIGTELARQMRAGPGSSLTLLATTTEGNLNAVDVVVRGVASAGVPEIDKRLVLAELATVQKLLLTEKVSTLSVYLEDTGTTEAFAGRLRQTMPQLAVRTWLDLASFYQAVRALYNRIFGILGAIMVVIVLFAMSNTLGMAVVERTREIGTLRALGAHPGEIVANFVFEGALIGAAGAGVGMVLAAAATLFLALAGIEMPPPPGRSAGYPLHINFSVGLYAAATAAVVAVSAGAAWFVSAKAARRPIPEALAHV